MTTTDLMPEWPYWFPQPGTTRRIRRALAARGYITPEPFRRVLNPPQQFVEDDDSTEEAPAYLYAWTIPYAPATNPHAMATIHATSVHEALYFISLLRTVQP